MMKSVKLFSLVA